MSAKFGLPVLDDAIGGSVPRGFVILLEEDAGLSEDVLVSLFIAGGLLNKEHVFVLNTDYFFSNLKGLLSSQGIDVTEYQKNGRLAVMNAFGPDETSTDRAYAYIHNVSDFREIHNTIKAYSDNVRSPETFRGVVDSLSTIILSAESLKDVFAFVRSQVVLQKRYGGIILLTVHSKAHPARLISALEHIVDAVIELRKERYYRDWRSILQIKKFIGRQFSTREFTYVVREGKFVVE